MTDDPNPDRLEENVKKLLSSGSPDVPMPGPARARILASLRARALRREPAFTHPTNPRRIPMTTTSTRVALAASILALALAGGTLFHLLPGGRPAPGIASDTSALERRLEAIEGRLGELDGLREEIARLSRPASRSAAGSEDGDEAASGKEDDGNGASAGEGREADSAVASAGKIRAKGGDEGLRAYIARVVDEQRQER